MIEQAVLDRHIARCGPYLVHATADARLNAILRDGLLPNMPTERWDGIEGTRAGGVYLGTDEYVSYHMDLKAQLRIDLRLLDPSLIQADEDHFCDHFGLDRAHRMNALLTDLGHPVQPIDTSQITSWQTDWRALNDNEHAYHRWQQRQSTRLGVQINYAPYGGDSAILVYTPDENTPLLSTGAWAHEYSWALDHPLATEQSLALGSIRYADAIAPTAIEVTCVRAA